MILGVQETWFKSSENVNIMEYSWFGHSKESTSIRGESGVGFLVHSSIMSGVKFETHSQDARIISLVFNGCVVFNVYNFTSQLLDQQCEVLESISNLIQNRFVGLNIIILGDFNAWVGKHFGGGINRINESGKRLIDFCNAHSISLVNVLPNISDMTFVPAGTIIDYIGIGPSLSSTNTRVIPFSSSSHNIVISEVILNFEASCINQERFHFDEENISLYQERLAHWYNQIWTPLCPIFDDNSDTFPMIDLMNDVKRLIIHLASIDSFKVKSSGGKRWWNSKLTFLFKRKRQLYYNYVFLKNAGFSADFAFSEFKEAKCEYSREIRQAKRMAGLEHRVHIESLRKSNPKQFWKGLKSLRSTRTLVPTTMYSSNGDLVSDRDVWADAWKKIGEHDIFDPNFDSCKAIETALILPDLLSDDNCDKDCDDILNCPVTFDEVKFVLNRLALKAGGLDNIQAEQLKYGGEAISKISFDIITKIWDKLAIPQIWKLGVIFPLFKKGDKHQVDNYRGITLQCLSLKVLDKLLAIRLKNWMSSVNFVHENQGGYQAGHWTQDWLFVLREVMFEHKQSKKPLYICFFDVRKAFDRVWHQGLFSLLHSQGIRGQFLRLLYVMYKESYSTVLVNGMITKFFELFVGVKQGGCTSPDLYIIFVNQLAIKLEALGLGYSLAGIWLGLLLFCDDMVIISQCPNELQRMINVISIHCTEWRYSLAVEKTKVITVSLPFGKSNFKLNGVELEEVVEYKYLGGVINRNLSDRSHFEHLLSNLKSSSQSALCLGVRNFSIKTCQVLFDSLVASAGTYGSQTFIPRQSMIQRFDIVMRKFYKRAFGSSVSTHNCLFFGELMAHSFEERFAKEALGYLWRLYNAPINSTVSKIFNYFLNSARNVEFGSRSPMSSLEYMLCLVRKYEISIDPMTSVKQHWINHLKLKMNSIATDKWNAIRNDSTVLSLGYNFLKNTPQIEWYANHHDAYTARLILKLRSGSCALMVSTGRYSAIPRDERICPLCDGEVEDVLHFCSKCPVLTSERSIWKESIISVCEDAEIPRIHKIVARTALDDMSELDMMRLLLCSNVSLSFSGWIDFDQWWPLIEEKVFQCSMNAIYKMYRKRIDLLYK